MLVNQINYSYFQLVEPGGSEIFGVFSEEVKSCLSLLLRRASLFAAKVIASD